MLRNWIDSKLDLIRYREEKHISNRDETIFYIIRRKPKWEGFFSNYFYVLSHIIYADMHGWKSVVDMQNYPTLYSEEHDNSDILNCWEAYFEQPDSVGIDEAYASNNYILSKNKYFGDLGVPVYTINQGHITESMVKNLYSLQMKRIPIHDVFIDECNKKYELISKGKKLIGVHVRGTDMYKGLKLHSIPPQIGEIFSSVDSILNNQDCDIFLCTDESRTIEWFESRYGKRAHSLKAFRAETETLVGIHKQESIRPHHHFLLGKEVLLDSLMLSKCDYLICGVSNVTSAAVLFNNLNYKKVVVIK